LRSYRANGGKLIQYHGWGDAAIAPRDSIAFYEKMRTFMTQYPDPRNKGSNAVDDFYRLFMVPGMGHCSGGAGPVSFGNVALDDNPLPQDAQHDIVMALDKWVTEGVTPERLIGTGKIGTGPEDQSKGTKLTRPLCPYPQVAKYKGTGSTFDAANFVCKAP
jgi:feruloyl esterase